MSLVEFVDELRQEHVATTPFRSMKPAPVQAMRCGACEEDWPCRVSRLLTSWDNLLDQIGVVHMDALRLQDALTNTLTHLSGIRAAGVVETDRLCRLAGLGTWTELTERINHALYGDGGGEGTRTAQRSISVVLASSRTQVHEVPGDTPARGPIGAASNAARHQSFVTCECGYMAAPPICTKCRKPVPA